MSIWGLRTTGTLIESIGHNVPPATLFTLSRTWSRLFDFHTFGVGASINHAEGEGVSEINYTDSWGEKGVCPLFLHKPYLVKVTVKGEEEGDQQFQKSVHVVYGWSLRAAEWQSRDSTHFRWKNASYYIHLWYIIKIQDLKLPISVYCLYVMYLFDKVPQEKTVLC